MLFMSAKIPFTGQSTCLSCFQCPWIELTDALFSKGKLLGKW